MSDTSQGSGWWRASDGKWYPPEQHPDRRTVRNPDRAQTIAKWVFIVIGGVVLAILLLAAAVGPEPGSGPFDPETTTSLGE